MLCLANLLLLGTNQNESSEGGFNHEFLIIDDAPASDTEDAEPASKEDKPLDVGGK